MFQFLKAIFVSCLVVSSMAATGQPYEIKNRLIEPVGSNVVLTLDACGGQFDMDLAHWLIEHGIKTTLFVTATFIRQNPVAVQYIKDHLGFFDIQNHGKEHHAAIESVGSLWGVPHVGSFEGLIQELDGGEKAIHDTFGVTPIYYRGATAAYDASAEHHILEKNYVVGGYSISLDDGGTLDAKHVLQRAQGVKAGDVLLGHINRPQSENGKHLIQALMYLQTKGFNLIGLDQVPKASLQMTRQPIRHGP